MIIGAPLLYITAILFKIVPFVTKREMYGGCGLKKEDLLGLDGGEVCWDAVRTVIDPMGMGMRNGSFGTVTAVSDSSITITVMRGGPDSSSSSSSSSTTKTYTINSSTKITVDGSTGSVGDIATGDTVMIEADSDDSSIAASIRVGMGGMPGQGQTQSATNSTSSET